MKKIIIIVFFLVASSLGSVSTAEVSSENRVKAAYLYNFAKFIKWPENTFQDKSSPIVFGILGKNALADSLEPLTRKKIRNHPIEIQYFETLEDIPKDCQLLYLDIPDPDQRLLALSRLKTRPTVTISDSRDFASEGGVIQFATIRDRLRFIINHETARKNNIQIDAQLLSLAIDIVEEK